MKKDINKLERAWLGAGELGIQGKVEDAGFVWAEEEM